MVLITLPNHHFVKLAKLIRGPLVAHYIHHPYPDLQNGEAIARNINYLYNNYFHHSNYDQPSPVVSDISLMYDGDVNYYDIQGEAEGNSGLSRVCSGLRGSFNDVFQFVIDLFTKG